MSIIRNYLFCGLCRTYGLAGLFLAVVLVSSAVPPGSALAGAWSRTGPLVTPRDSHTATLLNDGQVMVAGGFNRTPEASTYLASSELYNPVSGSWSNTAGPLKNPRAGHTATLLNTAQVLVVGGRNSSTYLSSSELYNPDLKFWRYTLGALSTPRTGHTATLLNDGRVLVVGGEMTSSAYHVTAWYYDPGTETYGGIVPPLATREGHTATLLANGKVLVAGGRNGSGYVPDSEVYDPIFTRWDPAGPLGTGTREPHGHPTGQRPSVGDGRAKL